MSTPPEDIKKTKTTIFAVRTTIGQEKSVLNQMFIRLRILNPFPDLKAFMIVEQLRGYVFVEATHQRDVMIAISGLRHIKGKIVGSIGLESISHVIIPRKVTEILEEGDIVEISSGIFQNQKAKVIRMPKEGAKEEVTLRLMDSDSAISIKIHADYLKLIQKGKAHQEQYIIKKNVDGEEVEIELDADGEEAAVVAGSDATQVSDMSFDDDTEEYDEEESVSEGDEEIFDDEDEDEDDEWSKFSF